MRAFWATSNFAFYGSHQQEVNAQVTRIRFKEEIETGKHLAAEKLEMNEIAQINLSTNKQVVFEPYSTNHVMGGLILIDKMNFDTVGAGIIKLRTLINACPNIINARIKC